MSRMEKQAREGVCQKGCGLPLSGPDAESGVHCCLEALRSLKEALEGRSATLEHEARMARLGWNRREQFLLAQVTALQNESRLAALQYQRRLQQYLLHISSAAQRLSGFCKVRSADMQNQTSGGATCAELQKHLECFFKPELQLSEQAGDVTVLFDFTLNTKNYSNPDKVK